MRIIQIRLNNLRKARRYKTAPSTDPGWDGQLVIGNSKKSKDTNVLIGLCEPYEKIKNGNINDNLKHSHLNAEFDNCRGPHTPNQIYDYTT